MPGYTAALGAMVRERSSRKISKTPAAAQMRTRVPRRLEGKTQRLSPNSSVHASSAWRSSVGVVKFSGKSTTVPDSSFLMNDAAAEAISLRLSGTPLLNSPRD